MHPTSKLLKNLLNWIRFMVFFEEKMNDDIFCMQSLIFFQLHRNKILSVWTLMQPTDYSSHLSVHSTYILQSELHIKGEITIITPNHWWSFKSPGIIVQIYCLFSTLHQTNDDRAPSRILPILSGREQLDVPSEPIERFLHQWDLLVLHHL